MWGLALLIKTPFQGNEFAGNKQAMNWLVAVVEFWISMRNADGSVNEWYENEHSYCSTAFTAMAVGETLLAIPEDPVGLRPRRATNALEETVSWLAQRKAPAVANQVAAGLLAMDCLGRLTGSSDANSPYQEWRINLLGMQHSEGWFEEYGGADIGYSLLTLDLLVHLNSRRADPDLGNSIDKLVEFIAAFVRPGEIIVGEICSRGTNHCFPFGVERLAAGGNSAATHIAQNMRESIRQGMVPTPVTADDTYAAYFYSNSYCLLAAMCELSPCSPTYNKSPRTRYFPGAGLVVYNSDNYIAVVNLRKGVWQLADYKDANFGDSGFVILTGPSKQASSQLRNEDTKFSVSEEADEIAIKIEKTFGRIDADLPLGRHVVSFKLVCKYILRNGWFAIRFAEFVKKIKVMKARRAPYRLERDLRLSRDRVVLTDRIYSASSSHKISLYVATEGNGMHSPSSQLYSRKSLMANQSVSMPEGGRLLADRKRTTLRTRFEWIRDGQETHLQRTRYEIDPT